MTGKIDWGLARSPDGGIMGVYSLSQDAPIKISGSVAGIDLSGRKKYSEWLFLFQPGIAAVGATSGGRDAGSASGTGASTEPDAPAQTEEPAIRAERCNVILDVDMSFCAEQYNVFGTIAGDVCAASAQRRNGACNARVAMPVLESHRPKGR
jgi:hypothetical protein